MPRNLSQTNLKYSSQSKIEIEEKKSMGFGATPTAGKSIKNFMSFNWKKKATTKI